MFTYRSLVVQIVVVAIAIPIAFCVREQLKPRVTPPQSYLRGEFKSLKWELLFQYSEVGKTPPPTLAEFMRAWEQRTSDDDDDSPKYCKWLKSGKDPWGSPFHYDVDTEDKMLTIRSFGPNRKDEFGSGDDVQHRYDLESALRIK